MKDLKTHQQCIIYVCTISIAFFEQDKFDRASFQFYEYIQTCTVPYISCKVWPTHSSTYTVVHPILFLHKVHSVVQCYICHLRSCPTTSNLCSTQTRISTQNTILLLTPRYFAQLIKYLIPLTWSTLVSNMCWPFIKEITIWFTKGRGTKNSENP